MGLTNVETNIELTRYINMSLLSILNEAKDNLADLGMTNIIICTYSFEIRWLNVFVWLPRN